jgi:SAM-dependent methyltransferase
MYHGLEAEYYDLLFGEVDFEEYQFYRSWLQQLPGQALEIGCGTGRLLIPYLQEGFQIHGLDNAPSMLKLCKQQAEKLGLAPQLYPQSLESIDTLMLPLRYTTIYIPSCVFMYISSPEQAERTLEQLYHSLASKGQLLISLYIPNMPYELSHAGLWKLRCQTDQKENNHQVICSESSNYEPFQQLHRKLYKYELYHENRLIKTEITNHVVRWYGPYEITSMLKQAGFIDIKLYGDYTLQEASDHHTMFIVTARKSS